MYINDIITLQLKNINKTTDLFIEPIIIDKYEDVFTYNQNPTDHTITIRTDTSLSVIEGHEDVDYIFRLRISNKTLINMRDIELDFNIVVPSVMNVQEEMKTQFVTEYEIGSKVELCDYKYRCLIPESQEQGNVSLYATEQEDI